ncbi:MAG: hypothetical protein J7J57_05145 [Caldisericaceae bacterium]|nr:hypothetical protein [Caldisericaceae bacterium]RLD18872.1 MAG: hypothetical protein DRI33_03785 [Caldisericota bacterium]
MRSIEHSKQIKGREVLRKIHIDKRYIWFVQALLSDTGLVALSLGNDEEVSIFYDKNVEDEVLNYLREIEQFCCFEFY